jgi:serine phosphatase RsbU (regulator of sigma subunit)
VAPLLASAEDRLSRLQRVSLELTAAVSVEQVLATVIDVLDAPVAAPSRSLWLADVDGGVLHLAAHRGLPPEAAARFVTMSLDEDLPGTVAARERRTVVSTATRDAVERFSTLRDVPRSTAGFVAIPLLHDATCLGVLGIGFDDALDERDRMFFEAVAAQVAQTIVRVRLTERESRRRTELELLARLTDTALDAADHLDLMEQACAAAVPTLGDWCALVFLPEDGGPPLVASAHVDPAKEAYVDELLRRHPYDPEGATGIPAVIRAGTTAFVPRLTSEIIDDTIASSPLDITEATSILEHLEINSVIIVPMRTKRRVVGAMQLVSAESGRRYGAGDVDLAEAVAGRLGEALDATWMADQQRNIAATLQRALLPPELPAIPGLDVAARYWPAGASEVGGDFYDVFPLPDRRWALLIGDVCGTGPDAAALTSIARHTVRAAARHGVAPRETVEWLNEAVRQSHRNLPCTACYATLSEVDSGVWHLTSTAAGHPLPIIATNERVTDLGTPGTLLGVFDDIVTTTANVDLRPGDVVVLYTDGITDLPPPYGITPSELADLIEALAAEANADDIADGIHRSLLDRVPDRRRQDDVALLVVRIR